MSTHIHTRLELDRNNKGNAFIGATDFDDDGMGIRSYVLSSGEDYIADAVMERRFRDMERLMAGNLESSVVTPAFKNPPAPAPSPTATKGITML